VELQSKTRNGETIEQMLERAKTHKEGVVVIVHEESLTPALLPKLRDAFRHVTFFILGRADAERIAGNDVLVVTPKLAAEDEKEFLKQYEWFMGEICSA
jgi:bisphosphoglycerate-independent phosphoglycerate mutase (AlkP superfamily)